MRYRFIGVIIALLLIVCEPASVSGQSEGDQLPIYVVQPGENLTQIADRFRISVNDLIIANGITDSNLISAGTELRLPGFEGISGRLMTRPVEFGENLTVMLRESQLSLENFLRLNNITSPSELYIGANIIFPQVEESPVNNSRLVGQMDSNLTVSIKNKINPWFLSNTNFQNPSDTTPNEILFFNSNQTAELSSILSENISNIEILPLPIIQGRTSVIRAYSKINVNMSGSIDKKPLNFYFSESDDFYYALHGSHALSDPGLKVLNLNGEFENGDAFSVEQTILMVPGGYLDEELSVEQTTIAQDIVQSEDLQVQEILKGSTSEKLWQSPFRFPVDGSLEDGTIGFTSLFGSRRSYNQGQYQGYHGGLDFEVRVMSFNVYAPARGKVLYTGTMDIRGKTIFIDHGQGLVSGYAHLREINVNVGDLVEPGQLIGEIGNTGRVTGPHLHWDIFINGIPVNPLDWINNYYP